MPAPRFSRISIHPLHALFAAEVGGVDLAHALDDDVFAEVAEAFDTYSVLVFPGQQIGDDEQDAFSRRFGDLEMRLKGALGGAAQFARISNVDPSTDSIIATDDPRLMRQYSNELWHTDSSFKRISAKASLLHGREVPPMGGDTSFACMRAAWDDLPEGQKRLCRTLVAEHSFAYSRSLTVKDSFLTQEQIDEVPPVPQRLVVSNPRNGREALYVASHASHILGWPVERGRALIAELIRHATQPKYVYSHKWRRWDLVMWDNRATMHRGSSYDYARHRRVMVRTTVAGDAPTVTTEEADRARQAAATAA